jgi:hypothetical protein
VRTVWQRLLDRLAAGDVSVRADEVRLWNAGQFQDLIRLAILREMELVESVVCDQCGDPHWAGIHWKTPGVRACFGCPTEGVIDIEIDKLRQWRIDTSRIAELLAEAFELAGTIQSLELGRLWHLGKRRLAGRFRDVFLAVTEPDRAGDLIERVRRYGGLVAGIIFFPQLGDLGSEPTGITLVDLAAMTRIAEGTVILDFEYLDGALPEPPSIPAPRLRGVTVPPGMSWQDVSIVVSEGLLQITISGKRFERAPAEAGFGDPDQRFELLRFFAAGRGILDADKIAEVLQGNSPPKKRVSRLRQLLQDLIEIDGDPIELNKNANSYRCQFGIRLEREYGFPSPSGTTWFDLCFHEQSDGRLAVSSMEIGRLRVQTRDTKDGKANGDVAEQGTVSRRLYSLEDLGLQTVAGKVTAEGMLFRKLLRGGGRLSRREKDLTVLSLAKLLSNWTGLEGQPLQISEAANFWKSQFACSSDIQTAK